MSNTFRPENFKAVWDSLPEDTKDAIRAKANWEHMTLSAVIRDWWPELWQQVKGGAK